MTEHTDGVSITPEAWEEFFALSKPLLVALFQWAEKHNMPLAVAVGALYGLSEVAHRGGNGCDCAICLAVSTAVADEVSTRMLEPILAVRH